MVFRLGVLIRADTRNSVPSFKSSKRTSTLPVQVLASALKPAVGSRLQHKGWLATQASGRLVTQQAGAAPPPPANHLMVPLKIGSFLLPPAASFSFFPRTPQKKFDSQRSSSNSIPLCFRCSRLWNNSTHAKAPAIDQ